MNEHVTLGALFFGCTVLTLLGFFVPGSILLGALAGANSVLATYHLGRAHDRS